MTLASDSFHDQHVDVVIRALRKSGTRDDRTTFDLYILAENSKRDQQWLAYDYEEFEAFIAGVIDHQFDPEVLKEHLRQAELSSVRQVSDHQAGDDHQKPTTDWDAVPLPFNLNESDIAEVFSPVEHQLVWVASSETGPAWARLTFAVDNSDKHVTVTASEEPPLSQEGLKQFAFEVAEKFSIPIQQSQSK